MENIISIAAYVVAAAAIFMAGRSSHRPKRRQFTIENNSPIELEFMMDDATDTLYIRAVKP